jgi:hypothetical protein
MAVGSRLRRSRTTTTRRNPVTRFVSQREEPPNRRSTCHPGATFTFDHAAPFLHVGRAVQRLEAAQQQRGIAHGDKLRGIERRKQLAVVGAAFGSMAKASHAMHLGAVRDGVHAQVAGDALDAFRSRVAPSPLAQREDADPHRGIVASAPRRGNAFARMGISGSRKAATRPFSTMPKAFQPASSSSAKWVSSVGAASVTAQ